MGETPSLDPNYIIDLEFGTDKFEFVRGVIDFESLLPIEPVSTAERISKYPEMYSFRPPRRPKKMPDFPLRRFTPEPGAVAVRVVANEMEQVAKIHEQNNTPNVCDVCHHWFRSEVALGTHRKYHFQPFGEQNKPLPTRTPRFLCPYQNCTAHCDCQTTVNEHVRVHHGRDDLQYDDLQFSSWAEFERWKETLEHNTTTRYVQTHGKYSGILKNTRYSCFFTRTSSTQSKERKNQRVKRSRKSDCACTAFMNVREVYGHVQVRVCLTHIGHEDRTDDLPLSIAIKKEIAGALIRGVPEDQILNNFRDCPTTDRRFYIKGYEVRNIAKKLEKNKELQSENQLRAERTNQKITGFNPEGVLLEVDVSKLKRETIDDEIDVNVMDFDDYEQDEI